jgi:hypothetical protein
MFYFLDSTVAVTVGTTVSTTVGTTIMPAFSIVLAAGGIFLMLLYAYAASEAGDAIEFKYDAILRERMNQLGIVDWQDLGKKAGLTRFGVRLVRRGDVKQLTVEQMKRLATVLNLNVQEVDRTLGSLPTSAPTSATANRASEIEELRQQCFRLREELQQQKIQLTDDFRRATFEQLQTLLTNYPAARKMAEAKPDMPAKNLSALFTPLENLLSIWGFDITEGELVYIRFVGYRDRERILVPAKVSRTLPGGTIK